LRDVAAHGHRAGEIVASIRALARKEPTRMTPTDLHEAIREVLLVLNGEFRRRGIDASFQAGPEAPIVLGDRTQLQQVLLNLVMNSVEAMTEPDGVGVRMGGQLTIRSAAGPDRFARVSVQDTGTGLEQDHMDRIFEAFFSTKAGGIGMGLSICRSIVQAHGGSISASNHSPRGSTFSFTVPLAAGAAR
jgi:signal transduction histidine kinase